MPNPFKNMGAFNNLRSISQMARGISNPMNALENIAKTNPQIQPYINAIRSGANPESVFKDACNKMGVDPNEIMRSLNW